MPFKCQQDSFLKEFTSTVVSCEKASFEFAKLPVGGFNVILDDTILFPEGGGQPCDYGTLNGCPVRNVTRSGNQALHFVEAENPFDIGSKVKAVVNWTRRLDNMQQHSAQHLITALFEQKFALETKSWWLGSETSYIEIHSKDVCQRHLNYVEILANKMIFDGKRVDVTVTSVEEVMKTEGMRATRGLPADHCGPVRVVHIEDLESNMCCGTHVKNLSQLQGIKMLHIEPTKKGVYVHFLAGERVLKKLNACFNREIEMTKILKSEPDSHLRLVKQTQNQFKETQKVALKLFTELATFEADKFNQITPPPNYYALYRKYGMNTDFITTFLRLANKESTLFFLSVDDGTDLGHIMLKGPAPEVQKFSKIFVEILNGKGNSRDPTCFQAKVNCMSNIKDCDDILASHFP